jgi:hypothetical protein
VLLEEAEALELELLRELLLLLDTELEELVPVVLEEVLLEVRLSFVLEEELISVTELSTELELNSIRRPTPASRDNALSEPPSNRPKRAD